MRPIIVLLFVIGSIFAVPVSATADTPGCVVRSEFRQVHNGMTRTRVHRIFDTSGRLSSTVGGHEARTYRPCQRPRVSFVSVHFSSGHVVVKFAIWG
jgi:hypothetical protein